MLCISTGITLTGHVTFLSASHLGTRVGSLGCVQQTPECALHNPRDTLKTNTNSGTEGQQNALFHLSLLFLMSEEFSINA